MFQVRQHYGFFFLFLVNNVNRQRTRMTSDVRHFFCALKNKHESDYWILIWFEHIFFMQIYIYVKGLGRRQCLCKPSPWMTWCWSWSTTLQNKVFRRLQLSFLWRSQVRLWQLSITKLWTNHILNTVWYVSFASASWREVCYILLAEILDIVLELFSSTNIYIHVNVPLISWTR